MTKIRLAVGTSNTDEKKPVGTKGQRYPPVALKQSLISNHSDIFNKQINQNRPEEIRGQLVVKLWTQHVTASFH